MKLLLVQIPTSHLGAGEKVYPIGLSRLSSLVPSNIEKHVLDMNICLDPWVKLKNLLENNTPDIVCLSFRNLDPLAGHYNSYLSSLNTAAMLIRNILPKTRIIAGGPAFSLFAKRLMEKIPQIDIGFIGEGELVFDKVMNKTIHPDKIPGIIWRNGNKIIVNKSGAKISMNDIPDLDVASFSPNDYAKANTYVAAIGIEGKRGCDLWCGYCLYPFLGGTRIRLRSPKKIVDEMQELKNEFGIQLFHFTDPVLNRPEDHFENLCLELINRKLDITWTGFFREDNISAKSLNLAQKAGLIAIYFSGDSLTEQGLALLNKKLTCQDIINAAKLTSENKILTMCHFLVNLPGDNDESIKKSKDMLDMLLDIHGAAGNLGAVIFNHIRLYPNAPITQKLIRSGMLDPKTDLLYPVYYNPDRFNHIIHEFELRCHSAGVFSRLGLTN